MVPQTTHTTTWVLFSSLSLAVFLFSSRCSVSKNKADSPSILVYDAICSGTTASDLRK